MSKIRELYMEIEVGGRRFSQPGEVLTLKPGDSAEVTDAYFAQRNEPLSSTYTVQSGDSLSSIVQRFGVKEEALRKENPDKIDGDTIYAGDTLIIPQCPLPGTW